MVVVVADIRLLNQTEDDVVEMRFTDIFSYLKVSIVALTKGEIRIVQASMLGSILSNLLLVRPSLNFYFFYFPSQERTRFIILPPRSSECVSSSAA